MNTALPTSDYDLYVQRGFGRVIWRSTDRGLRLVGDRIGWWAIGGRGDEAPLGDIAEVNLKGGRATVPGLFVCGIRFKDGRGIRIANANAAGAPDHTRDQVYCEFVRQLHARLSPNQREAIRFTTGSSGWRASPWASALLPALAGLAIAVLLARVVIATDVRGVLLLVAGGILAARLWQGFAANKPGSYDPYAIPDGLLPPAGLGPGTPAPGPVPPTVRPSAPPATVPLSRSPRTGRAAAPAAILLFAGGVAGYLLFEKGLPPAPPAPVRVSPPPESPPAPAPAPSAPDRPAPPPAAAAPAVVLPAAPPPPAAALPTPPPSMSANSALTLADAARERHDYAEATRWDRVAAEAGDAKGQFNLGLAYSKGDGVAADPAEAVRWYRRAADQGLPEAQNLLAKAYAEGQGVGQDYAVARRWYRLAADQGNVAAQLHLGTLYATGRGTPRDYRQALHWYRLAAAQGDPAAQFDIGLIYAHGLGVPVDRAEARRWMEKAAAAGEAGAQRWLDAN